MNLSMQEQDKFEIQCQIFGTTHEVVAKLPSKSLVVNHISLMAANGVLMVPTILLNSLAIVTIIKSSQLYCKPCYFIILLQSAVDLAVGALGIPAFLGFLLTGLAINPNCILSVVSNRLTVLPLGLSTNTLCAMTLERYIAIIHPYAYKNMVTTTRLLTCIGCSTVVLFLVLVLSFKDERIIITYGTVITTIVLMLTTFAYAKIYAVVRKCARSRNKINEALGNGNLTRMKLFLQEVRQARSSFIVVICFFVLCFLPNAIAFPSYANTSRFDRLATMLWILFIAYLNSSVNSLIFFWTKTMLRKEAAKMLRTVCLC